jgi:hypothetical protein
MDEKIQDNELQNIKLESTPISPKKSSLAIKHIISGIIILILMIGSTAGAYFWRDNQAAESEKQQTNNIASYQKTIATLEKQIADTTSGVPDNSPTPCAEIAPDATTVENIQLSITSGNTAALEGYMASSVNVILAASEAYGAQTPTQAISDISQFISDDINSWDYNFTLPAATLNTYKASGYAQYFATTSIVGKATNEKVISFSFDCLGKIDTVFLSSDENLL